MTFRETINVQPQLHRAKYRIRVTTAGPMLVLLLMMLWTSQSSAQVLYGSIVGTVTDPSGAVIPGATVTATQTTTNETRTGTTNEAGTFSLVNVSPGVYRIDISKADFQQFAAENINVAINAVTRVDATLSVGGAKQQVIVSAQTAELKTDRADVSSNIGTQELLADPQPTRTYQGLLATLPGQLPPGVAAGGTVGTNNVDRAMTVQSNGTSQSATDVRIDGVSAAQPWVPYRSSLVPSVEAIETVNVVSASADSSQMLASGATVNVQLKSGTNQFHGEGYWYHEDNFWAAKPYFLPPGAGKPRNLDNDFGGTVGGPILKDKLFFFVSYEGDYTSQAAVANITVPTLAILGGDFTGTGVCKTTSSAPACTTLYDPATGNPNGTGKRTFISEYGSNTIPADRISPNVKPLLAMLADYPPSATPPAGGTPYTSNLGVVIPKPQRLQKWDTKFDWVPTQKLRVTGRFNYHPYDLIFPSSGPAYVYSLTSSNSFGNTKGITVAATYLATPSFVIDGSWGFSKSIQTINPPYSNVKYGANTLGISGVNLSPLPIGGGIPNFFFNNTYSTIGYNYPYLNYSDPIAAYAANGTLTRGSTTIKFGTLIEQQHISHIENAPDTLTFAGNATLAPGNIVSQYNSYADFLLGMPSSWNNSYLLFNRLKLDSLQYGMYVAISQQISPNLTFNYGTSWSYFPVPSRGNHGPENLNMSTTPWVYEVCGYGGIPKTCGITSSWGLFGPHLGLAYRATPSLVVRAGASITPEQFNMFRDLTSNYPEVLGYTASGANPYVPVGTLSAGVPVLAAPNYQAGIIPLPTGASFVAIPQHIKRGYTPSYNLTIEKEARDWLFQVGYVGNQSISQHARTNINYGTVGGGVQSGAIFQYNGTTGSELGIQPLERTNYNSLQATAQKRFSHGYQIRASYTYAKWLGICCDTNGFGGSNAGGIAIPIPQYYSLNYAAMPGDRTHDLAIVGTVESPFGKGKQFVQNGPGAYILGGWQFNAQELIITGPPFSVSAPGTSLNAPGSTQRADQIKPHVATYPGNIHRYFDTSAFAPVTAVRFGTAGFDSVRGPGAAYLDASLFRSFKLSERFTAQFRVQGFNVTNSPHFGLPNSSITSGAVGTITSTAPISRVNDFRYFIFGAKLLF